MTYRNMIACLIIEPLGVAKSKEDHVGASSLELVETKPFFRLLLTSLTFGHCSRKNREK